MAQRRGAGVAFLELVVHFFVGDPATMAPIADGVLAHHTSKLMALKISQEVSESGPRQ